MAASLMGSYYGIGVDVDQEALEIAQRNFGRFEIGNVDLIYSDVQTLNICPGEILGSFKYYIVLMLGSYV